MRQFRDLKEIAIAQDHNHLSGSGGRGDRISEGENGLDCAECGAQGTQFFRPQVLGQFVSTISRHKEMTCPYQEPGDGG
jgi:hypothetical protein